MDNSYRNFNYLRNICQVAKSYKAPYYRMKYTNITKNNLNKKLLS